MSRLTLALDAAFASPAPTIFGAVLIEMSQATVALLDGAGVVAFGGRTYAGRDTTYGVLDAVENLTEGMGDEAPGVSITLLPSSDAAAADLAGPSSQGAPVTITVGAIDPATGSVIGTHVLFQGEIDVPRIGTGAQGRELEFDVVSAFERFFDDDEGIRLAPGWHRSIWPDEAGMDDVTGATNQHFWGVEGANGANSGITFAGGIGAAFADRGLVQLV